MQLIAASDFRNTAPDKIEVESGVKHSEHVHKGARFSIGGNLPFEKLTASDKKLVVELNASGRIISVEQKELAKRVDSEVASADLAAKKRDGDEKK